MKLFTLLLKTVVVIFTLAVFLVLVLIVLVKFRDDSAFAQKLKKEVIRKPFLVDILNLNHPGDARYVFFDPDSNTISVILLYHEGFKHNEKVEIWLREMILETLSKKAQINSIELSTIEKDSYSNNDLNEIRDEVRDRFGKQYDLFIIYLSKYQKDESNIGITLHRDTIFIFKGAQIILTNQISTLNRLERSTLMHEWGHLLGIEHVDDPSCIMSKFVEVEQTAFYKEKDIPVEYCPEIIQELKVQSNRYIK